MTVRINKPALNLREELTKAQGVVRYEQRQFWMEGGLVDNGTFDTADGWAGVASTTDGRWYVSNGRLTKGGINGIAEQIENPFVAGKTYLVQFDVIAIPNGIVSVSIGNATHQLTSTGTQSVSLSPTDVSSSLRFSTGGGGGTDVVIDNVSVFEVDENNNVIYSVPLGFKPVHVYENGLLQREGEEHDYTVVDTGFGYQIKLTVEPSATTETCVIAEREL